MGWVVLYIALVLVDWTFVRGAYIEHFKKKYRVLKWEDRMNDSWTFSLLPLVNSAVYLSVYGYVGWVNPWTTNAKEYIGR